MSDSTRFSSFGLRIFAMYLLLQVTQQIVTSYVVKKIENALTDLSRQEINVTELRNFDNFHNLLSPQWPIPDYMVV